MIQFPRDDRSIAESLSLLTHRCGTAVIRIDFVSAGKWSYTAGVLDHVPTWYVRYHIRDEGDTIYTRAILAHMCYRFQSEGWGNAVAEIAKRLVDGLSKFTRLLDQRGVSKL